ncbi:MAG: DUF554 family protein [Lachnospiraceae bacterium]|nr:DUF554 family protein [Lachnospiraceae bacterium]MDD3795098.1 DUF554 family protein [Lachnospiraceae bacterium]
MPIGVITDCLCVLAGALAGCAAGHLLPEKLRTDLNVLLGFCSIAIGIISIIKVSAMAPVAVAVLLGYVIGAVLKLEDRLTVLMGGILRRLPIPVSQDFSMERYITVMVLFCASGFGIYGTFVEAMSGDSSILLSKSVLDAVTALIFAITLRYAVVIVPAFMLVVLLIMSGIGSLIAPIVTPSMLLDFTACGGILTMAAGLRVSGIKVMAITNLIPALILVMPLSWLWDMGTVLLPRI